MTITCMLAIFLVIYLLNPILTSPSVFLPSIFLLFSRLNVVKWKVYSMRGYMHLNVNLLKSSNHYLKRYVGNRTTTLL